jgi:hypothetical protein
MEAGRPGVALSEVEETEEQHTVAEVVEGIAGRPHFRIGPAKEMGKKYCGGSRRLSAGGRMRQTISGLESLPLWPEV